MDLHLVDWIIIVTYYLGARWGTTHMDHRLVGASVTQIFVSKVWGKPTQLYYVGTPPELIDDPDDKILRGTDSKYLNLRVPYAKEDLKKAELSLECHKSQKSPQSAGWIAGYRKKFGKEMWLRQFVAPVGTKSSIFD